MIRRFVSTAVLAAAVSAPSILVPATSHAALFGNASTSTPKAKTVKMTLKNRTSVPMDLMIEDKAITLAPNAEYALNVPEEQRRSRVLFRSRVVSGRSVPKGMLRPSFGSERANPAAHSPRLQPHSRNVTAGTFLL